MFSSPTRLGASKGQGPRLSCPPAQCPGHSGSSQNARQMAHRRVGQERGWGLSPTVQRGHGRGILCPPAPPRPTMGTHNSLEVLLPDGNLVQDIQPVEEGDTTGPLPLKILSAPLDENSGSSPSTSRALCHLPRSLSEPILHHLQLHSVSVLRSPASKPLHLPFPLPDMLFPWLVPFLPTGLSPNGISKRSPLAKEGFTLLLSSHYDFLTATSLQTGLPLYPCAVPYSRHWPHVGLLNP